MLEVSQSFDLALNPAQLGVAFRWVAVTLILVYRDHDAWCAAHRTRGLLWTVRSLIRHVKPHVPFPALEVHLVVAL